MAMPPERTLARLRRPPFSAFDYGRRVFPNRMVSCRFADCPDFLTDASVRRFSATVAVSTPEATATSPVMDVTTCPDGPPNGDVPIGENERLTTWLMIA